jgi:hypothetical protein
MSDRIIRDPVTKENFFNLGYAVSCEDCVHFDPPTEKCTFNYPTEAFLRRNQLRDLETIGEIAFCRVIEID